MATEELDLVNRGLDQLAARADDDYVPDRIQGIARRARANKRRRQVAGAASASLAVVGLVLLLPHGGPPPSNPPPAGRPTTLHAPFAVPDDVGTKYCTQYVGPLLVSERITPSRAIVLNAPALVGSAGAAVVGSWVSARPVGSPTGPMSVIGQGASPSQVDQAGWRQRIPMAGATLTPGTTYKLFIRITMHTSARYDGIDYRWSDGAGTGVVTKHEVVREQAICP